MHDDARQSPEADSSIQPRNEDLLNKGLRSERRDSGDMEHRGQRYSEVDGYSPARDLQVDPSLEGIFRTLVSYK